MAKKHTVPAPTPDTSGPDAFVRAVEDALNHFADVTWLGEHSSLAAPYFLGRVLDKLPDAEKPIQRGRALQQVLQDAAAQLLDDQRALLRVTFFQTSRGARLDNAGIALALHLSERSYYRYRAKTIQDLADALNRQLMPSLRPELPHTQDLVGRAPLIAQCLHALQQGQSVCITGESGIGKTALGAAIAHAWQAHSAPDKPLHAAFWHTVRLGLNDRLHGFLFPLAYFLRLHGAANTWRQLVADNGQIEIARVLGLLRFDLVALKTTATEHAPPVLLCIDEVDTLQPERSDHAQILHILEELMALVPVCLIGQHPILSVPHHIALTGLDETQTEVMFARAGLDALPLGERDRLQQVARGNPAMLTLLMTLQAVGGDVDKTLHSLAAAPSMEALLLRIWRYLNEAERGVLMALAVFRGVAPEDAWGDQAAEVNHLQARNLIQSNGMGGISLTSHIHRFIAERVPAEHGPVLNVRAAAIREARGEYIEAMYHYIEAGQLGMAVWLWLSHSVIAVERGFAGAALDLLKRIAPASLENQHDREALHIARGALLRLLGKADEAEGDLRSALASDDPQLRGEAHLTLAMSLEDQGRIDQAQAQYQAGLQSVGKSLQYQKTQLHARLSRLNLYRLGDLTQARDQSLRARVESLIFSGQVEDQAGNYPMADAHYRSALTMIEQAAPNVVAAQQAPQTGFLFEKSRIYAGLGVLGWRQNNATAAVQWLERAIDCDQARGDVFALSQNHVNLSGAYIIAGDYQMAVDAAQRGLAVAEPIQASFTIGGLATNAAEACFYLGRFDDAEQYVMRSLRQEEEGNRPYALTVLGLVRHAQHKFAEAATLLKEAVASAQAVEDKYAEAAAWRALGNARRDEPNAAAAHEAYAASLKLYQSLGLQKEIGELTAALA